MAQLYQKQNIGLSQGQIAQPDKQPSVGAAVAKFGADALDTIAKDNFALGHANLANNIITTAYEANPMDLKKFNEMVQTGIEKSTKNLPGEMARKIRQDAEKKALALNTQIKNNMKKAYAADLQANTQAAVDDITGDGPMGLKALNMGMMDCAKNRDWDGFKTYNELWKQQHERLSNLAELKNPLDGSYIIGKESERNMYKQGLYGKSDAFRNMIETLSKDGLKTFDEEVFQDKKKFMEGYGIDFKTYDDFETLIKNRRKAFDNEDKRVIKDQSYFELSKFAASDPTVLDDMEKQGIVSKDSIDEVRKAQREAKKKGNENAGFYFGDQNEGFLAGLAELQSAISTDDGSPDYNDKVIKAGAKASVYLSKMHQNGLGDEQYEILSRALSGIVSDQNFAGALDISDSSLLSEIVRGARHDYDAGVAKMEEKIRAKYPDAATNPMVERQMIAELRTLPGSSTNVAGAMWTGYDNRIAGRKVEFSNRTGKALKELAARYTARIIALENSGMHEQAMGLRNEANKELIYLKYADWIPRQEFARLEREVENGHKAYTHIGNSIYQFKGLSQNGVILEGEF